MTSTRGDGRQRPVEICIGVLKNYRYQKVCIAVLKYKGKVPAKWQTWERVSGKWYNIWNEDYKFSFCVDGGILCECRAI